VGKSAAVGSIGQLSSRFADASSVVDASPNATHDVLTRGKMLDGWMNIERTYRPHTRWWWPGNAVTKDGIRWELDQMRGQGLGGVELMTPWRMYADGNVDYLSKEHLALVAFTMREAEKRDMEVAFSFCPGWKFGGYWVPPMERSKVLSQGWTDVHGPSSYRDTLPEFKPSPHGNKMLNPHFVSDAPDENQIVAVVAARVTGGELDGTSLVDLKHLVKGDKLDWEIPDGTWRLMAYRLKYTGELCATTENFPRHEWVVDHFNPKAVHNYCDYLGGKLYEACGSAFGNVLDTLFSDSFEVMVLSGTIHWSNAALQEFQRYKGYDLTRYLPAIWWNIGELTPKIRYDVNEFLGWLGVQAFFKSFIGWSKEHNIDARIQPYYRFTEELIQGAGLAPRPEMEVTTPNFTVQMNPRKSVAAGGHLYGREIISAEAYTFLHPQRYRTTLEEMKIASDAFLRDGATQLYNHGYVYSPEMHVAPSRDIPWANRISHWNTWWKDYHYLTDYLKRCCYLLRQGKFAGDVLVYSPQATVWTEKVLFNNDPRVMPYGNVGQMLVANGYDFDPVNDDILQNHIQITDGQFHIQGMQYRFLILPSTRAVPVKTMETIRAFVLAGGVVIALGEKPSTSVGLINHEENDARVRQIVEELFAANGQEKSHPGGGRTYTISDYGIPSFDMEERNFNPTNAPLVPEYSSKDVSEYLNGGGGAPTLQMTAPERAMIRALNTHLRPDFSIRGEATSAGMTFLHRSIGDYDLYFVSNLSPNTVDTVMSFRVSEMIPEAWEPMTGAITPVHEYTPKSDCVEIPAKFNPYASRFYLFKPGNAQVRLSESTLEEVRELNRHELKGLAGSNGTVKVRAIDGERTITGSAVVQGLPDRHTIAGTWRMELEGYRFEKVVEEMQQLRSWTENPRTRKFSGTGFYSVSFEPPKGFLDANTEVLLDLGVIGNVAAVDVNGRHAGVVWMRPYTVHLTDLLHTGENRLDIRVTNTLINYVSQLDKLPGVPETLVPHYGKTAHIYQLGTGIWEHREKGFSPLPVSGLLGPVTLIARRRVTFKLS
jgi:hypothetical protein